MNQPLFGLTTGADDAGERAGRFGVDFVDLHFEGDVDVLLPAIEDCDRRNIKYVLNFERAPIGWNPPQTLRAELADHPGFLGFMLDEADHMQINAHWPVVDYYHYENRHFLAETDGMGLEAARNAVLDALAARNAACILRDKPAAVEFLFPAMMHTAARAGLTVSPKILKETCGPAMLAVAMGAVRQYGGNSSLLDFWIDVDYWWHNEAIGHSPERFRSALLLAYWSGASQIYVEGGAHLSQSHPAGLEIERSYAEFLHEYVPAHPRPYNWHDFQPEIAIIRFDDTCFDERQRFLGEYPGPLYGHIAAGPENTEWLNIWSLLSHGFVRTDSLSHQWESRRFGSRTLFVPLNNVAVYDHEVGYRTLAGLRLIFLTGHTISSETYRAVQRCVQEGAICVLPPRLAPPGSGFEGISKNTLIADGQGSWLVVPNFYSLHYETFCAGPVSADLRQVLQPLVGDGDHLVFGFNDRKVRFNQAGGDYPRQKIMTWVVPMTQAGSNPDVLEVDLGGL